MDYQAALQYIMGFTDYERQPRQAFSPANFDLRRVEALLARLGNPHLAAKTVHIAGTKGKGSTAAMIQSALRAAGFRVGLFTSPHLLSFRERIQVDGRMIPGERLAAIVERMKPEVEEVLAEEESFGRLTTFELIAALAFVYFAEEAVNFQVVETGLGGRLDATNVVSPLVAVITSISLDHTAILGNTLAAIAKEKCGIIKPGSIAVTAPQATEARRVIIFTCSEKDVHLLSVGQDVTWRSDEKRIDGQQVAIQGLLDCYDIWLPLIGDHQQENAATAVAAIEALRMLGADISSQAIAEGLKNTVWPGRLQIVETSNGQPLVVVDGAHNGDSAARLRQAIRDNFPSRSVILILGTSADKDIGAIVEELGPLSRLVIVTRSAHPRAAEASAIVPLLEGRGVACTVALDVPSALREAKKAAVSGDLILVSGSLFVVAEILAATGLKSGTPV
ncbi:MAG: bifunctional folylpolyglutamate synthase/dihydrofolate synthase [Chloroflexi bacterium]|nr:bifunctional folylpolyglutamate synthase/dihydrofolate synthase [Chloroflexota bacterium]